MKRLIKTLRANYGQIASDFIVLIMIIVFVIGSFMYLYKYSQNDKEAYSMNIVLTAFVTRMSGLEFIQAIRDRMRKVIYHFSKIMYKRNFINQLESSNAAFS